MYFRFFKYYSKFEKENVVKLEAENRRILAQLKQIELTCERQKQEIENLNNLVNEKKRESIEIQKKVILKKKKTHNINNWL